MNSQRQILIRMVALLITVLAPATLWAQGTIITFAGGGDALGDGGPATAALLSSPTGVFADALGNVYIADTGNHRIRKVDSNGIITTVAGTGSPGFTGDGGPATLATLHSPGGVYADALGTLLIADTMNNVIRTVNAAGTITTIVHSFSPVFSVTGDNQGNVYFSAGFGIGNGSIIWKLFPAAPNQPNELQPISRTVSAGRGYSWPAGAAVANRSLYFTDRSRINRADGMDGLHEDQWHMNWQWRSVVGNGEDGFSGDGGPATLAGLNGPSALAADGATLFIADTANHRIRKVDLNGIIATIAGSGPVGSGNGDFAGDGGPATLARLNYPGGIAIDKNGTLYIADTANNRIRRVKEESPAPHGQAEASANKGATEGGAKTTAPPTSFSLRQNLPNPFNPNTLIAYDVPQQAHVVLAIYNLLGQEVVRLVDGERAPGTYAATWDGRNARGIIMPSGVYLYRLSASTGFIQTRRMTLLK